MPRLTLLALSAATLLAADDDWPRWRGPTDNGMARGDAPQEWGDDRNIAWKAKVPGRGHSSPVIWADRIFVTTAVPTSSAAAPEPDAGGPGRRAGGGADAGREHRFLVLCYDRHTGKLQWEQTATVATPHEGYHRRYGSFASNSPVTDGRHVYAFFGSRGLYAFTLEGKLVWKKEFPPMRMRMAFGEGTAAVLDDDRLILNFDQEGDSFIVALDKTTGKELWRQARDEGSAWAAPLVVSHEGRKQVIVAASNRVRAYELADGGLIWEAAGLGGNVIPAPVAANGVVYVMSGYRNPNMMAIRLGRTGDLTGTDAILWTNQRGNPYTPSPVLDGGKLYFLSDNGMLSSLDAATGRPHYLQQRLPKPYNFKSSPVGAAGKLYLASEHGDVVVVRMGETLEVVATNTLADEMFIATPAIAGGALYLRGKETLYCIRGQAR